VTPPPAIQEVATHEVAEVPFVPDDREPAAPEPASTTPPARPPWELYLPTSGPGDAAPSEPFARPSDPVAAPFTEDESDTTVDAAADLAEDAIDDAAPASESGTADAELTPTRRRRRGRRGGRGRRRAAATVAGGEATDVGDDFVPAGGGDLDLRDDAPDEPVPVSAEPSSES
jgi:ribonuclease E